MNGAGHLGEEHIDRCPEALGGQLLRMRLDHLPESPWCVERCVAAFPATPYRENPRARQLLLKFLELLLKFIVERKSATQFVGSLPATRAHLAGDMRRGVPESLSEKQLRANQRSPPVASPNAVRASDTCVCRRSPCDRVSRVGVCAIVCLYLPIH